MENSSSKQYLAIIRGAKRPGQDVNPLIIIHRSMLSNATYYPDPCSIYPGEYEPLPWQQNELSGELKNNPGVTRPAVRVVALPDYYNVEIPAPGFKREDFFIDTRGESLSITGVSKKNPKDPEESSGFHDCRDQYIQRDIVLPSDVDTEFATAEYANGILRISLFRTKSPTINRPGHIIVY